MSGSDGSRLEGPEQTYNVNDDIHSEPCNVGELREDTSPSKIQGTTKCLNTAKCQHANHLSSLNKAFPCINQPTASCQRQCISNKNASLAINKGECRASAPIGYTRTDLEKLQLLCMQILGEEQQPYMVAPPGSPNTTSFSLSEQGHNEASISETSGTISEFSLSYKDNSSCTPSFDDDSSQENELMSAVSEMASVGNTDAGECDIINSHELSAFKYVHELCSELTATAPLLAGDSPMIPEIQGMLTRARAQQLKIEV